MEIEVQQLIGTPWYVVQVLSPYIDQHGGRAVSLTNYGSFESLEQAMSLSRALQEVLIRLGHGVEPIKVTSI